MDFSCKKTENCFVNAQTYAYALPLRGAEFLTLLDSGWAVRKNEKLRRPVFVAEKGALTIKGVLLDREIRVSFPEGDAEAEKRAFETWLRAAALPREDRP